MQNSEAGGDYDKRTALHLAASCAQLEVVKLLVEEFEHRKDVVDRFGNTPLDDIARERAKLLQKIRANDRKIEKLSLLSNGLNSNSNSLKNSNSLNSVTAHSRANGLLREKLAAFEEVSEWLAHEAHLEPRKVIELGENGEIVETEVNCT